MIKNKVNVKTLYTQAYAITDRKRNLKLFILKQVGTIH